MRQDGNDPEASDPSHPQSFDNQVLTMLYERGCFKLHALTTTVSVGAAFVSHACV